MKSSTREQTRKGSTAQEAPAGTGPAAKPLTPAQRIEAAKRAAFTDEHPEQALAHFRPLAEAVPTEGLPVFTGTPLVMKANVRRALELLEPHLPAVVARVVEPGLKEVFELPSLVMALDLAIARVPSLKLSAGEVARLLTEGAPWRALALKYLEVVSDPLLGLVPQERVAALREGTGKLDQAQDFVAIPALFQEFAGALGHHPIPADRLARLSALGATLVQQIRPRGAAGEASKRAPEAVLRDQLASLVEARYDHLQVLACVALGRRRADALLPALRSFVHAPARDATDDQDEGRDGKPTDPTK